MIWIGQRVISRSAQTNGTTRTSNTKYRSAFDIRSQPHAINQVEHPTKGLRYLLSTRRTAHSDHAGTSLPDRALHRSHELPIPVPPQARRRLSRPMRQTAHIAPVERPDGDTPLQRGNGAGQAARAFQFAIPIYAFERRSDGILRISMLGHRTRYAGYPHRYCLAPPPCLWTFIRISSMKRFCFSNLATQTLALRRRLMVASFA